MPTISARDAIESLIEATEGMRGADLCDMYYELFPARAGSELPSGGEDSTVRGAILEQLRRGVEIEEILDLWNVAFPKTRRVHFDDEAGMIRYEEGSMPLSYAHQRPHRS